MKYYPYGDRLESEANLPTDRLFTGQRYDDIPTSTGPSAGLYPDSLRSCGTCGYYGARYYDPEIGRFISADTIIPNPADPQSFNRYSYCLNNPLKYTDPSGRHNIEELMTVPGLGEIDEEEIVRLVNGAEDPKPDLPVDDYITITLIIVGALDNVIPGVGWIDDILIPGIALGSLSLSNPDVWEDEEAKTNSLRYIAESKPDPYSDISLMFNYLEARSGRNMPSSSDPSIYSSWRGGTKVNKNTGEVWKRNETSHGGKKWDVYKDKKAYDNNDRDRTVWDDGRVEKSKGPKN